MDMNVPGFGLRDHIDYTIRRVQDYCRGAGYVCRDTDLLIDVISKLDTVTLEFSFDVYDKNLVHIGVVYTYFDCINSEFFDKDIFFDADFPSQSDDQ